MGACPGLTPSVGRGAAGAGCAGAAATGSGAGTGSGAETGSGAGIACSAGIVIAGLTACGFGLTRGFGLALDLGGGGAGLDCGATGMGSLTTDAAGAACTMKADTILAGWESGGTVVPEVNAHSAPICSRAISDNSPA